LSRARSRKEPPDRNPRLIVEVANRLQQYSLRIPTKPAGYSDLKAATHSDLKAATIPI